MESSSHRAVAVVGIGAVLPDAPDAQAFWDNLCQGRSSIREVPEGRWSVEDYYDADPQAQDKTYSKIGAWVEGFEFDWKRFRIPPRVAQQMDAGQQWAVTAAAEALRDYGYPERPLDRERIGVILGTAMGGDAHLQSHLRVSFPEYRRALESVEEFRALPEDVRAQLLEHWYQAWDEASDRVTEDTMPGELPNIVSGRVASVLDLRGPNFISDAACASSLAALSAAIESLNSGQCDAVLTGGVDHNMATSSFVKFSKIGALSATGSRPFAEGADGFVMGEGSGVLLLRRLADAERDGDRIYAVIRGIGASSDGKGKGITAPNPIGQRLAVQRAWDSAGLDPATASLVEAHGTSTAVGDRVEAENLIECFAGAKTNSVALGSVKSNIGHLKGAAGAAGLLKTVLAIHHRKIPPTLNAETPSRSIDFERSPFRLARELSEWRTAGDTPRRAGVGAYGFGGTNFHVVLEEYRPGMLVQDERDEGRAEPRTCAESRPSLRGILALGAPSVEALRDRLDAAIDRIGSGWLPPQQIPATEDLSAAERLVIDFGDAEELRIRVARARKMLVRDDARAWTALQAQGVFRGSGARTGSLAFLFPGQGSQYLNMGRKLYESEPVVRAVFDEADRVMTPILGRPLTGYLFIDAEDESARKKAEAALMDTAITQPAVLSLDTALARLLAQYGIRPDLVMGHSLGEYAALIEADIMPFAHALEAVAARGREMSQVEVPDKGWMAAVFAPYESVVSVIAQVEGYVEAANINSPNQCVIGGETEAVKQAMAIFEAQDCKAVRLPVSHAFHTRIVAPAGEPLRRVLDRLDVRAPNRPVVANVTGAPYPADPTAIRDLLQQQIASPVQWVKGLQRLHAMGARSFVEVGPKKALKGFTDDVLGQETGPLWSLFTNHPKTGELASFNQALCGLYAAGFGAEEKTMTDQLRSQPPRVAAVSSVSAPAAVRSRPETAGEAATAGAGAAAEPGPQSVEALGRALLGFLERNGRGGPERAAPSPGRDRRSSFSPPLGSVVITGTGLGLPGAEKALMAEDNVERLLRGEQFIDLVPQRFHQQMVDKRVTRLVKDENGGGRFEPITDPEAVIKLAGRPGRFDLAEEYDVPEKLVEALDSTTQMAMAAGLDALREAGIPLVRRYRKTSNGKHLPDRWLLPEPLRDETGVIFASCFPGFDRFADEMNRCHAHQERTRRLDELEDLRRHVRDAEAQREIQRRVSLLRDELQREPFAFDRRFLFRVLAMGHSQFAEFIGARGPNTQVNAACASTAQAVSIAEDWIRAGRCRRVIVLAADNVTGDNLLEWIGTGFLAVGAAATDGRIEDAALPFDRRRHGLLLGMGCSALVVESEDAVRERGMRGIVELLATEKSNSSFHGTRLDAEHISDVLDNLVTTAERRFGLSRRVMAPHTLLVSHETYTPARGGSASAEVAALRRTFGDAANQIVICNTKGMTGHPMSVGVEDVTGVKALEHGMVPPVPNFKENDPDLGTLNLSRGGFYPVQYAIRLAAGFGSQVAMSLFRRIPGSLDRIDDRAVHRQWLARVSGYDRAEIEVHKRVLRIVDQGVPVREPVPGRWYPGAAPTLRAIEGAAASLDVALPVPTAAAPLPDEAIVPASAPVVPLTEQPAAPLPIAAAPTPAPVAVAPSPPAAAAPVANACASASPGAGSGDAIAAVVLKLVAEKTGYPEDMLELDLDLEADLGIDTVKQAETFSALRKQFEIPKIEDLSLRDYPTLERVVQFVYEHRPDLEQARAAPGANAIAIANANANANEPSSASASAAAGDPVAAVVLKLVAEKTGYPEDMLELDLDLEADLGIDTVKQAETFSALRKQFEIPKIEDLSLRDYPTLERVVQFVYEHRPDLKPSTAPAASANANANEPPSASAKASANAESGGARAAPAQPWDLAGADQAPRRVPVAVLRPALELCQPTGVTLDGSSRVLVALDQGGAGQALAQWLESRQVQVLTIDPASDVAEARLNALRAQGPLGGVFWLPALDVEPELESLELGEWRRLLDVRVKRLHATMRLLYAEIAAPGCFLVAATRLGGLHGYGEAGALAPLGGSVTGFLKAYRHERPEVLVKAVDFGEDAGPDEVARRLVEETLADPGAVEIGWTAGRRFGVALQEQPAINGGAGLTLGPKTVFAVTGAAGGITSAIVADLAAASSGVFHLLDRVPAPRRDHPHLALFRADREALKRALIDEARAAGERPTPRTIDRQLMALEREEAALSAIEAVERAGGTARYHAVDLLDAGSVAEAMAVIREAHGRIDVLLHAAGLEISRALADKSAEEFALVLDVKADGLFNLLRSARKLPLGAVVCFSSVAGRFGNSGQTDYSAANDLLCKLVSHLRRARPGTRGIAIDWTAWKDIGMATRGSLPELLTGAGIDLLAPAIGVPTVRRELTAGSGRGELVVGQRLGRLVEPLAEFGGLDPSRLEARLAEGEGPFLSVGSVRSARMTDDGHLEVELDLDPRAQPFLSDHQVEQGIPYLPGVVGTEFFAEVAGLLAPGLSVAAVKDLEFVTPLKFHRLEARTLRLHASARPAGEEGDLEVQTWLESVIRPRKKDLPPRSQQHFSARIRLSPAQPEAPAASSALLRSKTPGVDREEIYRTYFHGPAYQVLESVQVQGDQAIGMMAEALPPDTAPETSDSVLSPRLIELCFQTAGQWEIATNKRMCLPSAVASATVYRRPAASNGQRLYAMVTALEHGESFDAQVVDGEGQVYVDLRGYRTVKLGPAGRA